MPTGLGKSPWGLEAICGLAAGDSPALSVGPDRPDGAGATGGLEAGPGVPGDPTGESRTLEALSCARPVGLPDDELLPALWAVGFPTRLSSIRLRLRILSTRILSGRGVLCSAHQRPQALQFGKPFSSLRHRGVVVVPQLAHV